MKSKVSPNPQKASGGKSFRRLSLSGDTVFVTVAAVAALVVRLLMLPAERVMNSDGVYYAKLAGNLLRGDFIDGISGYWAPLYPFVMAAFSIVFGDFETAGRAVSMTAGCLIVIPTFYLIKIFYGRKSARIAVVLLVLHNYLIKSSGSAMTEPVYGLIFISGVLATWHAIRYGKKRMFLVTGLLFGAAYLTKPEAIGYVALLLFLTLAATIINKGVEFKRYALGCLLILCGFASLCLPYVLILHDKSGKWTISQKIQTNSFLSELDEEASLLGLSDSGLLTLKDQIWGDVYDLPYERQKKQSPVSDPSNEIESTESDPPIFSSARTLIWHQVRNYIPDLIPFPFFLLLVLCFCDKPWSRYRLAREFFLFSFFVATIAGYALTVTELRYLFPVVPILLGWTAKGILVFNLWATKSLGKLLRSDSKKHARIIDGLVLIIFVFAMFPQYLETKDINIDDAAFEEKRAGLWIRDHGNSENPLVIATNSVTPFYAKGTHRFLPAEEFSVVAEYARRIKADFIVFNRRRIEETPNAFPPGKNASPYLELVYHEEDTPEYSVYVYRVLQ